MQRWTRASGGNQPRLRAAEKDLFIVFRGSSGQVTTGKWYLAVEESEYHMPQFIQKHEKNLMLQPESAAEVSEFHLCYSGCNEMFPPLLLKRRFNFPLQFPVMYKVSTHKIPDYQLQGLHSLFQSFFTSRTLIYFQNNSVKWSGHLPFLKVVFLLACLFVLLKCS